MDFIQALQTKDIVTENGMPTNSTSGNHCVDLFFTIGALRGQEPERILNNFIKAFYEDKTTALRILFWSRDVRDGAGERNTFRIIFKWLCENHPDTVIKNLRYVSYLGRWDDYLVAIGTGCEKEVVSLIKEALDRGDQLCAKWMPRKGVVANILRKHFKMTPKEYRKLLVSNTNVVENNMCSKTWDGIEYSKVPSLAMSRYTIAFRRNDTKRFESYLNDLSEGKTKVNTGAIYPYDVIKNVGNGELAQRQWESLPNYMEDCSDLVLPLVDVSGSMTTNIPNSNLTPLQIAVSLGLYISERNVGPFQNYFMTFSQRPQLVHTVGTLKDRFYQMSRSEWGMNTDLIAVFETLLKQSKNNNVRACDMPTKILIFSDMEFDACAESPDNTAMEIIRGKYKVHGYTLPKIVFWNLMSRKNNLPLKYNEDGTVLVSGFSPSILKSILNMKIANPYAVMIDTLNSYKYLDIVA
jgi:hypothetical protein